MPSRVIRSDELVQVPWKNGGGTTAEVAAFPPGAGFGTFGWRISMADVATDGPFSAFPGIDRTLIVVEGNGIELAVDGVPYRLDGPASKLSFSGDDPTVARLIAGPIRDLNVMTRRGQFSHRTRTLKAGTALLSDDTETALLVVLDGRMDVTVEGGIHSLDRLDILLLDPLPDLIPLAGSGRVILIEIAPDGAAPASEVQS
jgi:environmental stress-induced protein Ves